MKNLSRQVIICSSTSTIICTNHIDSPSPSPSPSQVMNQSYAVFNAWDDEYDKFSSQLREISKKKREETLKFSFRIHSAHKKLQDRIGRMRE